MPYNFAFYLQTDAKVRKVGFGWCLDVGLLGFDLYMDLLNRLYFPTKSQLWPFAKMIALFSGFFGGFNFHFLILTKINWVVVSNIFYFHPEHLGKIFTHFDLRIFFRWVVQPPTSEIRQKTRLHWKSLPWARPKLRSLADEPVDSGGSETFELVGHWVRTHVGWARGTQGREPKLVGIGREKVCGKDMEKKKSWLFYLVIFVCFFWGMIWVWRY